MAVIGNGPPGDEWDMVRPPTDFLYARGMEFRENADNRSALAIGRNKCGRLIRYACLDAETCALQFLLKQRGTLRFLVAHFRVAPNGLRNLPVVRRTLVHELENGPVRGRLLGKSSTGK